MEILFHGDFSAGWLPSADAIKGPKNGFLRGDNLVLDEEGILSLRSGAQTINPNDTVGVPVPMVSSASSVHSLFTATIDGTRYRCAGVDNQAFANFGSFGSFDGSGDIHFESHQGFILAARGTTHWKWDGTATRRWGIPAGTIAPTLQVLEPREITVATCDAGESPAWAATSGTVGDAIGQDFIPSGSREVFPSAVTGEGTIQKVFSSAQNYDSFDGGTASGAPEDSITFYVWTSDPASLEYVSVAFDVNPASASPFQDDYYYSEVGAGDAVEVKIDQKKLLQDRPDIEGVERDEFFTGHEQRPAYRTKLRRQAPTENAGWSRFVILRGQMERVGSTPGCNWSTVKAVQFTVKFTPAADNSVGRARFDDLRILGGSDRTLTGRFQAHYVWAREFPHHVALSGPSPISDEIECRNNAIRIVIPAAASAAKDPQLVESGGQAWGYIGGGSLRSFMRMGTANANSSGAISIDCVVSERDAIVSRLFMETDNVEPPNDPVAIIANVRNRTLVLTETDVWISRDGNPDSYSQRQRLTITDPAERNLWGIKSRSGEVLIGTTRDIYSLSGSLAELPDGTMDARLDGIGVNGPPVTELVVNDGPFTVYVAADGFRLLQGASSTLINWNLDLLVEGYTRHGVNSLNLGSAVGRFRGGIFNNRVYVMVPEGASTLSSNVVYVADLRRKTWFRRIYPRSIQVVYREPDGQVLFGDSSGCVWQMDFLTGVGDVFGDASVGQIKIPVIYWSLDDDNKQPIQRKEPFDWRADIATGNDNATVEILFDETSALIFLAQQFDYGNVQKTVGGDAGLSIPDYIRAQVKITGSFLNFKLGHWALTYRERPAPMVYWDSSLLDFGTQDLVWFREITFKGRSPVNLQVKVRFDGALRLTDEIEIDANKDSIFSLAIGKELKGRQPLIIVQPVDTGAVNAPNAFELYWLRVRLRTSGGVTEKTFKLKQGGV